MLRRQVRVVRLAFDQLNTFLVKSLRQDAIRSTNLQCVMGFIVVTVQGRIMPYLGLCFFQHPRIGQVFGGPCCFLRNYSDLKHRMATKLVWI